MKRYKYTKLMKLGPVDGFMIHTPDDRQIKDTHPQTIVRELNRMADRIKRLEEALDLVVPNCSWVHHSKKHQHQYGEPCPVVALIENAKEAKL